MTQDEALQILKTGANVFLTGEPGSGKSFAAARYVSYLRRENIPVSITASTGIAAAQLGGTTVHAWSGIGTRSRLTRADLDAIAKNRRVTDRIKKARVLIVDEVSMLSGQTLSAVNQVCQFVRKANDPFGGLQVVLVGDFFQLPPVVRRDERAGPEMDSQDEEDNSPFAYASAAWRDLDPSVCYLTEQHRQTDAEFSGLLLAIRSNACGKADIGLLASRRLEHDSLPRSITRLFTHNVDVDRINQAELLKLPGEASSFFMMATGDKLLAEGLKRGCLSPERLDLKKGAVVMFTKNDPDGRFVNGTLGVVSDFDSEDGTPVVVNSERPHRLRQARRVESQRGRKRQGGHRANSLKARLGDHRAQKSGHVARHRRYGPQPRFRIRARLCGAFPGACLERPASSGLERARLARSSARLGKGC